MKFTEYEYPILWNAIKEFTSDKDEALDSFKQFLNSYRSTLAKISFPLNTENIYAVIATQRWNEFPKINLEQSSQYGTSNYAHDPSEWFFNLKKKDFITLCKHFAEKGIDLMFEYQKNNSYYLSDDPKRMDKMNFDISYVRHSKHFIENVLSRNYPINTPEKLELFRLVLEHSVHITDPKYHRDTLSLLLTSVDIQLSEKEILSAFKTFVVKNPIISPDSFTTFYSFVDKVKDWNLDSYFTTVEKKNIFNKDDSGFEVKEVESLQYQLNLDTIVFNSKNNLNKDIALSNLITLINIIPQGLGNSENYVSCLSVTNKSNIELSISFEPGTSKQFKEVVNNILKKSIFSHTKIDPDFFVKYFESSLLEIELNKNINDTKVVGPKLKI